MSDQTLQEQIAAAKAQVDQLEKKQAEAVANAPVDHVTSYLKATGRNDNERLTFADLRAVLAHEPAETDTGAAPVEK